MHLDKLTAPYLPRIKHGDKIDVVAGKWELAIRPVKAADKSCLTCHTGAKKGDTLGAMVYMVHLKPVTGNVDKYYPQAIEGV